MPMETPSSDRVHNHQILLAARPSGLPKASDWELSAVPVPVPGTGVTRLDPSLAPLTAYLGALGITGLTAYFGLLDVGRASAGDTVVVSAAAGAVGSVAGQIARIRGCRVIGIAGGPEKCRWITDGLGFDAAVDNQAEDVAHRVEELAPDGVDVFLDNVGGEILDAVLLHLARGARVVLSGGLSQYNADETRGPSNYL